MDTKLICLSFLFGLVSLVSFGQTFPVTEMQDGYYVVIGVYDEGYKELADNYALTKEASTGYHVAKKRIYVYSFITGNYREAIKEMRNARENIHPEAWVFVYKPQAKIKLADVSKAASLPEKIDDQTGAEEKVAVTSTVTPKAKADDNPPSPADVNPAESGGAQATISELESIINNETYVAFLLSNARNNAEVRGEVQIIDTERAQLNDVIQAGEVVVLDDPENGTGRITAIADVFGYRKHQMELDYSRIFDHENVNKLADYYVIFFDLVRYHKGDIAIMYNVYFFNDAAVMRPESRYEVNSLLSMMKENPNYKIKIHGHTNGRRAGKIISRTGKDPFYALVRTNKQKMGSAKALSKERATIIRDYLISEGISPDRMEIKAWGGSRMLYDKNSNQAKKNVRVEIEILEE